MPFDGNPADYPKKMDASLDGLISWLEKQPGDTEYRYDNPEDCLMTRWHKDFGETKTNSCDYSTGVSTWAVTCWPFQVAFGGHLRSTYAEALQRAYKFRDTLNGAQK